MQPRLFQINWVYLFLTISPFLGLSLCHSQISLCSNAFVMTDLSTGHRLHFFLCLYRLSYIISFYYSVYFLQLVLFPNNIYPYLSLYILYKLRYIYVYIVSLLCLLYLIALSFSVLLNLPLALPLSVLIILHLYHYSKEEAMFTNMPHVHHSHSK